ncbi:MAG: RiPP maturation radical SAM C-methyltransferase [Acidobacteriota bacterium]
MRRETDCCFVNMPFMDVRRPSLALGLLQAALEDNGLTARTVYGNLLFCEYCGLPAVQITLFDSRSLLAEWVFSRAAFPGFNPDPRVYFDYFLERLKNWSYRTRMVREDGTFEGLLRLAIHLRTKVDGYLDELIEEVLERNPRIVGCSSTFEQHLASLALLRRIRERAPEVVTMIGGANCESAMGVATHRNFPWVDFVVSGEADHLIGPLVRSILSHGRDVPASELPTGVFGPPHRLAGYPAGEDGLPPRAVVMDMNSIPVPNYDDYFSTLEGCPTLGAAVLPTLTFQSSRGCWWHSKGGCTFCGLNGQSDTYRSGDPRRVTQQIREIVQRHGIHTFMMVDNVMDPRHMETLFPLLKADDVTRKCRFFYETKSNLEPRHLKALREAGVTWIQPGIESLNTGLLTLMNKGSQAWQNIQLLKSCLRYGVRPVWHVLYGFPMDRDVWYQEMADLMPLLQHLPPPTSFLPVQLERFSAYHSNPERFGLKLVPLRYYSCLYPLEPREMEQLAYFFDDERTAEFVLNPMFAFLDGNGLDAVRIAFREWKESWRPQESRPVLSVVERDASLLVHDTRKIAVEQSHELHGLRREVYSAADSGPMRESMTKKLAAQGIAAERIEEAIRELIQLRLAVEIDGRVLSLAVHDPISPFPTPREYPCGSLVMEKFIAARRGKD